MPPPAFKRRKLSQPSQRLPRVASHPSSSPRLALEKKLVDKPQAAKLDNSDDSDNLVKAARSDRNRRGVLRKEIFASGGVAVGDVPASHPSKRKRRQSGPQANQDQQRTGAKIAAIPGSQPVNIQSFLQQSSSNSPARALVNPKPTSQSHIQSSPAAEASILGTIKPRKRQPSILHALERQDSSSIGPDDEDDFLPNDESTPLKLSKALYESSTSNDSLPIQPCSLKRKLSSFSTSSSAAVKSGSAVSFVASASSSSLPSTPEPRLPSLPLELPRISKPMKLVSKEDEDIMAPPKSSSPLQDPAECKLSSPAKGKARSKELQPISTASLQALMPSKRRRTNRERQKTADQFDIPADPDSASDGEHNGIVEDVEEGDASFLPRTRGRRSKVLAMKGKGMRLAGQASSSTRAEAEAKARRRATSTIPSPIRRSATPLLPLRQPTKSPSQQPHYSITSSRTNSSPVPRLAKGSRRYASRRLPVDTATGEDGKALDKENQPAASSLNSSPPRGDVGTKYGHENAADVVNTNRRGIKGKARPKQPALTRSMQAIKNKFEDVDSWDLAFEDITMDMDGLNSSEAR